MSASDKPILVLGGGPAGLAAGLTAARAGRRVIVLEKQDLVGGVSSSLHWNRFILEYGPHTYHIKHDFIDDLVREVYGGPLVPKKRVTRMLLRGRMFDYPLKFWQLLRGLNPFFSLRMLLDFLVNSIRFKLFPRPDDSFRAWGVKRFGYTLYNLCFGRYTERLWGRPADQLSVLLASSKLHKLNLKDVIVKLLGGRGQEQATYWEDFLYPEEGMGIVFEKMADEIIRSGGEIWLESFPVAVRVQDGAVKEVTVERRGEKLSLEVDSVISTIPLPPLGELLRASLPESAYRASQQLQSRSLILVNLVIRMPMVSDAHWVYLLDSAFRFNRFCEQKNLLRERTPPLETMLTFEACCDWDDEMWNLPAAGLVALALQDISRIEKIDASRVSDTLVRRVRDAYPVYDLEFEQNLARLYSGLARISNLYATGRQGLFLNTDMHDTMGMGIRTVEELLAGLPARQWYARVVPPLLGRELPEVEEGE